MNILELDSYDLSDAVKFNDHLNPAIWANNKMRPEVRARLLAIAEDFKESLGLSDLEVKDITVSGSNAGYTYTPHSDVDVHLVVDIPQADSDEVYRELFDAKKYQYNDQHDYKIKNYDVELYVENANKPPHSAGIYSILNDDWIKIPRKIRADVNDEAVKSKFEDIGHRIESAVKSQDYEKIDQLAKKVKNFRQAGLDAHGELGPENLAYKILRTQGLIKQLYDARNSALDKKLSLKEKVKQPIKYGFKTVEDLDTDGVMMTEPTNCSSEAAVPDAKPSDEEILKDFIKFCVAELKIEHMPRVKLRKDPQWAKVHKTFGRYIDDDKTLEVAWGQRHIMDVLRTVAHELTHKHQHEREGHRMGPDAGETGSPYENEANARAGILMRDYGRLHPELFVAGQAEHLHGDEVKENFANYFRTSAPEVRPTKGTMNIEGYRVDYDAPTKKIVISKDGQVVHREGGTGQGRPGSLESIVKRARLIINQLNDADEVDESLKSKLGAAAAAACIAGAPGCATTGQDVGRALRDIQTVGRTAQTVKNMSRAGVQDELNQVARNTIRDLGNKARIEKHRQDTVDESASGYIPTKKQAKDPRFSMALTRDIKPGQLGKEANKLDLETDSQGHPQLLMKGLRNALKEFKETGQLPKLKTKPGYGYGYTPKSQVPGEVEDDLGNQEATGPEFPPEMPAGTTKIDVSDLTDWYRLGMDISDLDDAEPEDYGKGPPQTVIVFPSDEAEQAYLKQFKRLGLKTHDMDPDVKGGEDIYGKHLKEDEQIDEVKMSPSALRKFSASEAAEGILAGFEAELIFRNIEHESDDEESEPDMDADERCYNIDQVVEFFGNDEYGMGMSDRGLDRLREKLDEAYFEWRDDEIMRDFDREAYDLIREVWLEERPMTERIHDALVDGIGIEDEAADVVMKLASDRTKNKTEELTDEQRALLTQYYEAEEIANSVLDEEVEASLSNQDGYFDQALENFRDSWEGDDSGFFTDIGLRWMSDVMNEYNLDWPVWTNSSQNYGGRSWDEIAESLSNATGKRVDVGHGYHSGPRRPGRYTIEPDSSLSPDDSEDFGLEVISPPLPLNEAIEQLNTVVEWANNSREGDAYTNSSTGLHMGISIPYKGGSVDYVKLALFLGDEHVLKQFGRSANGYCKSALKELREKSKAGHNKYKVTDAMDLMRANLLELAEKYVNAYGVGQAKYTSIHLKPGYIEFRSPGGDYLAEDNAEVGILENTMRRFAYAMYLAGRPDLERKEYYKKLYKLISPEGNDAVKLFTAYATGELSANELKKQWAAEQLSKEIPPEKKSTWKLYDKSTGKPVPGMEFSNFNESDAWEKAAAKLGMSVSNLKGGYELQDMNAETGKWRVVRRDNGETLEIIAAATRGEAADQAYETYTNVIPYYVEPYSGDQPPTPEPKLSPRAKLAKRIAGGDKDYVVINRHSGKVFHTFTASHPNTAANIGMDYIRGRGLDPDNFSIQRASNVKQSVDNAVDSRQLQRELAGNYSFVYAPTGRVLDQVNGITRDQATAVLNDVRRRYNDLQPADIIMRRGDDAPLVRDIPMDIAQNIQEPAPRGNFELYVHNSPDEVFTTLRNVSADEVRHYIDQQEAGGMPPGFLRVRQVDESADGAETAQRALDASAKKIGYPNFAAVPANKRMEVIKAAAHSNKPKPFDMMKKLGKPLK